MNYAVPMADQSFREARGNFINEWISTKLNPYSGYMNMLGGGQPPQNTGMNVIPSLMNAGNNYAAGGANAIRYGGEADQSGILGKNQALMQGLGGVSTAGGIALSMLMGMGGSNPASNPGTSLMNYPMGGPG
jgi:hypothetical protein